MAYRYARSSDVMNFTSGTCFLGQRTRVVWRRAPSAGINLRDNWKVVRRESGDWRRVDGDPTEGMSGLNPDAIQRNERPGHRERRRTRRPPEAPVEHMRSRSTREPVVEVAEHDDRRIANRIEIVQDLTHLKSAFANTQAEVCREHMKLCIADIDRGRQRPARFAALHRQINPMHLENGMPREHCVAEAFHRGLPWPLSCRTQSTLVAIECRKEDGVARFQRDAGWIRELLKRDDVCVEVPYHGRDPIGIVTSVSPDAGVHVVGRDPKRRPRGHQPNSARPRWPETAGANWRISRIARSADASANSRTAAPIVSSPFDTDGFNSV